MSNQENSSVKKKKKGGMIVGIILSILLPFVGWILGIIALANVKKNPENKKQGWIMLVVSTVAFIVWIGIFSSGDDSTAPSVSSSSSGAVQTVKESVLPIMQGRPTGEVLEGFIGNLKWKEVGVQGDLTYVNASGKILINDKKTKMTLQFSVDANNLTSVEALEYEGQPQDRNEIAWLLENMARAE